MRRGYILLTISLLTIFTAYGQKLNPDYYTYPLKNVAGYYSANFGEMRPNHFHSGTDFKTDGVEGKSVVAVADGYVARVAYSPSGYGLALYVNHPNGTTSVYGHLSRFRKDIADFVFEERHRQQRRAKKEDGASRGKGRQQQREGYCQRQGKASFHSFTGTATFLRMFMMISSGWMPFMRA